MAEAGFEIDGEMYEVPRLETFDLDEEQILFDVSGLAQLDFVPAHPDASEEEKDLVQRAMMARVRDPRFKRALAHIAYRRRHLDVSFDEVQERMGKINALDAELAILGGGEDDPPAESSPSEPESETSSSESSSSEDSGSPSESDSAPVVEIRAATGAGR